MKKNRIRLWLFGLLLALLCLGGALSTLAGAGTLPGTRTFSAVQAKKKKKKKKKNNNNNNSNNDQSQSRETEKTKPDDDQADDGIDSGSDDTDAADTAGNEKNDGPSFLTVIF